MMVSDDATADWATIGVKVLTISLKPQGGGTAVTVFTAPSTPPLINLVQLDQLAEILGNVSVLPGTYSGASMTLGGNPGDVGLVVSGDPEPGFAATAGSAIPSSQIQILGATGSAGSKTVSLSVDFVSPLVVTANQNNALDLEFDLSHPTFIVAHVPPAAGQTLWAVNFVGPLRHHPIEDITRLVLRHLYGTVTTVAANGSSITITKDYPTEPPVNPEMPIASSQNIQILPDTVNGTLLYDLDAKTTATVMNFSSVTANKFVRVAARYQVDGTLVAVRVWESSSFNAVWVNPEGHVLHVNTSTNMLTVENETGSGVPVQVNASTQFFFRAPWNAGVDAKAIGSGTAFLSNLKRGFKVHVTVVDPLANPLVASTIDIEIARFDGSISSPGLTSFTYTHNFNTAADDYAVTAFYISPSSANGNDPLSGASISGFKWWNFAFPTLVTSGTSAVANFVAATNGASVNFGGTVGPLPVYGASSATWNDPANPQGWAMPWAMLAPSPVPLGKVAVAFDGSTFGLTAVANGGTGNAVTADVTSTSGSATLVYQVDRTGGIITITPQDITTTAGMNNVKNRMVPGTLVKAFGVPESNGHLKAYVFFYFTGDTMPVS